jgi:hypothetical protein
MEQSNIHAGAFAEHSGEVANQQKILALQFEETKETLGTALLPMIQKLMDMFIPLLEFTAKYADILIPIAGVILGIVAAMKLYELWTWATEAATLAAEAAQWLWNAAMMANPIGLIVLAIMAVIAILVVLYMKVDWFRNAVDAAIDGIIAAWNWLWEVITDMFNWVKDNWPLLLAILTGPFGLATKWIIDNWQGIKDFFWRLPGQIRGFLGEVWNIITYPFRIAAGAITAFFDPIKDFFWRLPGQIRTFFGQLADIITYPFKLAFNAVKYLWNTTVGGFGINVPSWVPGLGGKGWTIPRMASGGIVNRPTLALIGEAGPEAVVPLNGSGIGTTYIVNVYALNANAETGRLVAESLREYNRTAGTVVRGN